MEEMKKILAFGASSSSRSINQALASYAAGQLKDVAVNLLDLNDFEMPIYSADRERENGIPEKAIRFRNLIGGSDGVIISFAEHNSSYTAAYKNIFDWASRIEKDLWQNKPMLLMATSPGGRGGQTVLEQAYQRISRSNHNQILKFSLPGFYQNFDKNEGIKEQALAQKFEEVLQKFIVAFS